MRHAKFVRSAVLVAVLVAAQGLTGALPSKAQPPDGDREERARTERTDQARELVISGSAALEAGDLVSARAAFEQAYALTDNPAMLYNLGVVEDRAGNLEQAREHLLAFLRASPAPDERRFAEDRLADVERRIGELPPDPEGPADGGPDVDAPTSRRGLDLTALGVTLGVGGALAAGMLTASGVLWGEANASYERLAAQCVSSCTSAAIAESGAPLQVDLTNAMLVAGLATLGITAVIAIVIAVTTGGGADDVVTALRSGPGSLLAGSL